MVNFKYFYSIIYQKLNYNTILIIKYKFINGFTIKKLIHLKRNLRRPLRRNLRRNLNKIRH